MFLLKSCVFSFNTTMQSKEKTFLMFWCCTSCSFICHCPVFVCGCEVTSENICHLVESPKFLMFVYNCTLTNRIKITLQNNANLSTLQHVDQTHLFKCCPIHETIITSLTKLILYKLSVCYVFIREIQRCWHYVVIWFLN